MTEQKKIIEKTVYVASDGTEFFDRKSCVIHEAEAKLKDLKPRSLCPYVCVNETVSGEYVQNSLCKIMRDYFKLSRTAYDTVMVYKLKIRNETDKEWAKAFCISQTGEEDYNDTDFDDNTVYILCVVERTTLCETVKEVRLSTYESAAGYYEEILNEITTVFGDDME